MSRRPDLFIIGAAKCGTTSVYEYLKGHPEIYMSPAKEPRYFAPDLDSGHAHNFHYGVDLERYLSLFDGATNEKRVGEASVRYIYSEDAPRLIHEFEPSARIVAMLRDPVEMIYSLHGQRLSQGSEDIADFETALAAEDERRAGRRVPAGLHPRLSLYRDVARFGEQLDRWFDTFGRDGIHVIILEDFLRDPAGAFRSLLEFLEVDVTYRPSFARHNVGWAPRSTIVHRLTKARLPQWIAWKLLPAVAGEGRTRRLVRTYQHSQLYRRPRKRQPLRPELRRQLEEDLAPDVARLSELLGRDLAHFWWRQSADRQGKR